MIRLWLSRGTSIPLREQLTAQFILATLSRQLAPGERLPSVRELARRLNLHANTISAAYQDLAKRGWVSRRRGSGVFVRYLRMPDHDDSLDNFARTCAEQALARRFSIEALQSSLAKIARESRAQQFLVVDPDPHLAHISAAEIHEATAHTVPFAGCDEAAQALTPETCVLVGEMQAAHVRRSLGDVKLRTIQLKSMPDVLAGQRLPASAVLIAVVSSSESILHWAATLLGALGFPADSVLQRNPQLPNWQDGLRACDIVAADVVTAAEVVSQSSLLSFALSRNNSLPKCATL
jgi:DNA-binding transcriptional regulator YhcF (GntR family)